MSFQIYSAETKLAIHGKILQKTSATIQILKQGYEVKI